MTSLEKYNKVFCDVLEITEAELSDELSFETFDKWDSFTHMTLITELEEAFDLMFESEDLLELRNYAVGKKVLNKYGIEL